MMSAKKNVTLRAAAVLFALALITSCFVGGTFAKYVTGADGSGSARVAKFGVNVEAKGTLFAEEYDTDDENAQAAIVKSVISSGKSDTEGATKDNVVAPGTKGEMLSMKLSGQPEVAVQVTYSPTIELNGEWKDVDGKFYCPLKIKIGNHNFFGIEYDSKEQFVQKITEEIATYNRKYAPNTDLATAKFGDEDNLKSASLDISWEWAFQSSLSGDPTTAAAEKAANDVKDTYLGDQAAKGHAATISIEVVATVTQID